MWTTERGSVRFPPPNIWWTAFSRPKTRYIFALTASAAEGSEVFSLSESDDDEESSRFHYLFHQRRLRRRLLLVLRHCRLPLPLYSLRTSDRGRRIGLRRLIEKRRGGAGRTAISLWEGPRRRGRQRGVSSDEPSFKSGDTVTGKVVMASTCIKVWCYLEWLIYYYINDRSHIWIYNIN